MHAVNGRLFGNNPSLYMEYGSKVIWYLLSIGAQVSYHLLCNLHEIELAIILSAVGLEVC